MKNKILLKVIIIFLMPSLGMLFFSGIYIVNKYETLKKLKNINLNIDYISTAESLLNNIQKERGMSGTFIGSKGENFNRYLENQKILTNLSIKEYTSKYNFSQQSIHISRISKYLLKLKELRTKVKNLNITFENEIKSYNQITNTLIDSMSMLLTKKQNSKIDKKLFVILYLINIKEFAGLERAIISNILSNKYITKKKYNKMLEFISLQNHYIKNFKNLITLEELTIFYNLYNKKTIEEIEKYREIIKLNSNKQTVKADVKKWWNLSTKRIDIIGTIINLFFENILRDVEKMKNSTLDKLIFSVLLWVLSILASFISIILLAKITRNEKTNFSNLEKQKKMYNILNNSNELIIYNYTMQEVLEKSCKFVAKELDIDLSFVCLLNKDKLSLVQTSNGENLNFDVDDNNKIYINTLKKRKKIVINNIYTETDLNFESEKNAKIKAIATFPLYRKDETVGVMVLCSKKRNHFDNDTITIFDKLADSLSYGLEKEANEKLRLQYEEEIRIASYSFDSQEAMTITDKQGNIIKINKAFTKITGYEANDVIGKNPKVLKSGVHDESFYQNMWQTLLENGSWSGEIYNKRKNGEVYPERITLTAIKDEEGNTTHYIAQFFDITEIKKSEEKLVQQIKTDNLTGLFNRTVLNDSLTLAIAKALKLKNHGALMFIDLDNFKSINDTLGHNIGDLFLIKIANIIKDHSREDDTVIRLGGDEFLILVENLSSEKKEAKTQIVQFANKIRSALDNPIEIEKHKIITTSSIGITIFPQKINTVSTILKNADKAMYLSKEKGKNQVMLLDN